jgi:hypothetical protein
MSRWQSLVPLGYDVSWPLDERPCDVWTEALRLVADPDATLPNEV